MASVTISDFIEPVFGRDEFDKQRVLKGWEAIAYAVVVILFGKPGFYPSIPDLGMNIQQYRYLKMDEIDTDDIGNALSYQCSLLSDFVSNDHIQVKKTTRGEDIVLLFSIPYTNDVNQSKVLVGVQFEKDNITYHYSLYEAVNDNNS